MKKSKIIEHLEMLIMKAASKDSWLWHKGQQILLSPLSLKNNIAQGKYLLSDGWVLVPVESVIARYTAEATNANKLLANMMKEIEENNNHFKSSNQNETTLKVVQ